MYYETELFITTPLVNFISSTPPHASLTVRSDDLISVVAAVDTAEEFIHVVPVGSENLLHLRMRSSARERALS